MRRESVHQFSAEQFDTERIIEIVIAVLATVRESTLSDRSMEIDTICKTLRVSRSTLHRHVRLQSAVANSGWFLEISKGRRVTTTIGRSRRSGQAACWIVIRRVGAVLRDHGQSPKCEAAICHRHSRTRSQVSVNGPDHLLDNSHNVCPFQTLNANSDDRRRRCVGPRQQRVEVSVERHNNHAPFFSQRQDGLVSRSGKSQAPHVFRWQSDWLEDVRRSNAAGLGRARTPSRFMQLQYLVIEVGRRIRQGLAHVFVLQFRVFGAELLPVGVKRQCLEDATNCQPHSADARLPIHHRRITRDSVKSSHIRIPLLCPPIGCSPCPIVSRPGTRHRGIDVQQVGRDLGIESSWPKNLTVFRDELYFAAWADRGAELYRFNTDTGTAEIVADRRTGAGGTYPENLIVYRNSLYFDSGGADETRGLIQFDGEEFTRIAELSMNQPTIYRDELYFSHCNVDMPQQWPLCGVYRYDGHEIKAIYQEPYVPGDSFFVAHMFVSADQLYFTGRTSPHGPGLYRVDVVPEPSSILILTIGFCALLSAFGRVA